MGTLALDVYQALGALCVAWGFAYLIRGANLPGRLGRFLTPNSAEWRQWMSSAPAGYWRATGATCILIGAALLLMAQGCFHHGLLLTGLLAFIAALGIGWGTRETFGPVPRRTRGSWIRYLIGYTLSVAAIQALLYSGALDMCHLTN
jgi:hypothetical protein